MTSGMFLGNGVGVVPTYPTLKRGANKHCAYGAVLHRGAKLGGELNSVRMSMGELK